MGYPKLKMCPPTSWQVGWAHPAILSMKCVSGEIPKGKRWKGHVLREFFAYKGLYYAREWLYTVISAKRGSKYHYICVQKPDRRKNSHLEGHNEKLSNRACPKSKKRVAGACPLLWPNHIWNTGVRPKNTCRVQGAESVNVIVNMNKHACLRSRVFVSFSACFNFRL